MCVFSSDVEQLLNSDLTTPMECVHALRVATEVGSVDVLPPLCRHLVVHPLSSVSSPAASLALRIVAGKLAYY